MPIHSALKIEFVLILVVHTIILCGCSAKNESAAKVKPSPRSNPPVSHAKNPALALMLTYYDQLYNPNANMLRFTFNNPGYHSQIPSGTRVHRVRESLAYGLGLLQRGEHGDRERAIKILHKVVDLQDTRIESKTRGVWPWLLEEPLAEMSTPDFNWADFCGATIAHVLVMHRTDLPDDLTIKMERSLQEAARAIRQRDVKPGYSNIAILGGGVCAIAGELLSDNEMLQYGRERLKKVVKHVAYHEGFTEYNSPPYAKVVIAECERILELSHDAETRAAADSLRRSAWKIVAESFHPGTMQWAGPHSRTSKNRLRKSTTQFLQDRVGKNLVPHPSMRYDKPRGYAVVSPRHCPEEYLKLFQKPSATAYQLRHTFVRNKAKSKSIYGTTWFTPTACLGSVSRSIFWTQRKPVIGYWKTADDPAVVFRVRFLHDGKDFSSMTVRSSQENGKILSLFHAIPNGGDWHPSLDRPRNQTFQATDFRVRLELRGVNVAVSQMDDRKFALSAGDHRVVVHTLPGQFAGRKVVWRTGDAEHHAYVDGICYSGKQKDFHFDKPLPVMMSVGLELIPIAAIPLKKSPKYREREKTQVTWEVSDTHILQVSQP